MVKCDKKHPDHCYYICTIYSYIAQVDQKASKNNRLQWPKINKYYSKYNDSTWFVYTSVFSEVDLQNKYMYQLQESCRTSQGF